MRSKRKRVVIYGAKSDGDGKTALEIARGNPELEVVAFFDDDRAKYHTVIWGVKVLGGEGEFRDFVSKGDVSGFIAISYPNVKQEKLLLFRRLGIKTINLISRSAEIGPEVKMGEGNMVCPMAIIRRSACIGNCVTVRCGASIGHDCRIGDYVDIADQATLGGRVTIHTGAFIGLNATVLPDLIVEADAVVGAGAVVTKPVPAGEVVAGVPARPLRKKKHKKEEFGDKWKNLRKTVEGL